MTTSRVCQKHKNGHWTPHGAIHTAKWPPFRRACPSSWWTCRRRPASLRDPGFGRMQVLYPSEKELKKKGCRVLHSREVALLQSSPAARAHLVTQALRIPRPKVLSVDAWSSHLPGRPPSAIALSFSLCSFKEISGVSPYSNTHKELLACAIHCWLTCLTRQRWRRRWRTPWF